jgi:cystathionine beta-lyase/cystathionine gamma-synthase
MLDGLKLFGMGYSWGGFESLVIPFDCRSYRSATAWNPPGPALRFSAAAGTVLAPSGLAAITLALLTAVKSGDHILVTDAVYRPSRNFCATILARMGGRDNLLRSRARRLDSRNR